ncbi:MAG: aminotransferase class V-fold PLP-dependent enzyme [Candidatus Thermoplasmatota archaeon]|nr:aminotransferase class V-fold PLP-dependent enzyme [Candidatus Thermoplasmatota archaeon]
MVTKEEVREDLGITRKWIYLDNAATSPMRESVLEEIHRWYRDVAENGDLNYEEYMKKLEECRENMAEFMNVGCDNVAFLKNTGDGLNASLCMLKELGKREHRDTFVTTDMEYPSNLLPWLKEKHRVVNSKDYKLDINEIEKAIDEKTIALAISHVEFSNGFKNNIRELKKMCDEKGAKLVVDVVQSLGALELDPCMDIACGAGYKWLMGPYGVGIFYVSDSLIDEFPFIGHNSIEYDETERFDYENTALKKGARRFEIGNLPFPLIFALSKSVKQLSDFGKKRIEREVMKLSGMLIDGLNLEVKTPENRGAIVGAKGEKRIVESLRKKKISISARSGLLRFSPHFWNTEEEIEKVINEVNEETSQYHH